jgi:hypothetical protein
MHCRNYVRILRRLWITSEQLRQEKIILKMTVPVTYPLVLTISTIK